MKLRNTIVSTNNLEVFHTDHLTAVCTGLRRKELSELKWSDVDFEHQVIRARASTTKNRKDATLPMPESLCQVLMEYKRNSSEVNVFHTIPSVPELKKDLKLCGIPFINEQGKRFDFHALRGTFCTMLSCSNVGLRTAQALMRHSDPRLTSEVYTDEDLLPKKEAVDKLPSFDSRGTLIGTRISDISGQIVTQEGASQQQPFNEVDSCNSLNTSSYDVSCGLVSQDVEREKMAGLLGLESSNF